MKKENVNIQSESMSSFNSILKRQENTLSFCKVGETSDSDITLLSSRSGLSKKKNRLS